MNIPRDSINHRRSMRLHGYDYRHNGAYFVTICTHNRTSLFGEIKNNEMRLTAAGTVAHRVWEEIPQHFSNVATDAFIVMPNHVHGIIVIANTLQPPHQSPKSALGTIVGSYKSAVTKQINRGRGTPGASVWQRNYYEHVIRDETSLHDIRQYIVHNPAKWDDDPENPRTTRTSC